MAPTAPRRVSGPAAAAAAGGVIAVPAPGRTRPQERTAPRKRTSPGTRPSRSRRGARSAARAPWRLRAAVYLRALPDNVLLDRIVRGRVWIPLLGMLLTGIVFMQVEVLKLNAGIGRSLERGSALQAQNELLRASVSQLSDEQRIERIAAQMGLVMPGPAQLRFVHTGDGSTQRALGSIHAPNATDFIAQLPTPGAPVAAQGTTVNTAVGLAPTSPTTASPTTASPTTASPTTASPTTDAGTPPGTTASGPTPAGTTSAAGASTPQSTPTTPAAPTTSAGATDQSGSSSTGGVGAAPVGG